jgi:hypothetical protein
VSLRYCADRSTQRNSEETTGPAPNDVEGVAHTLNRRLHLKSVKNWSDRVLRPRSYWLHMGPMFSSA